MAAIYKIKESGRKSVSLASPSNLYYLLDGDLLLTPQSKIGYCKDCLGYIWIEDLSPPDYDEHLANVIEGWPAWYSQFGKYLETRQAPPRCLHCGGMRIAELESAFRGLNPVKGKRYTITIIGSACMYPELEPLFLSKEGRRLKLPDDRAEQLAKRGRGRWVA